MKGGSVSCHLQQREAPQTCKKDQHFLKCWPRIKSITGFPAPSLVAPSSAWTKVQPVVRHLLHCPSALLLWELIVICKVLVGLNSSHFFHLLRDASSQQLLPAQQEEGQCHWTRWRIGCDEGPLGSHTSPGTPRSEGFAAQALPQVCVVLTQWSATCCSGGTPENVIAKSCVEFVRKIQQFTHTSTGSYVQSTTPCRCESLQLSGVCCSDSCWCFPASLK